MSRTDRGFDIAIIILCVFVAFSMLSALGAFADLGSTGVETGGDIQDEYGEDGDSSEAIVERSESVQEQDENIIDRLLSGFDGLLAPILAFVSSIGLLVGVITDMWMLTSIFPGPIAWALRVVISAILFYSVMKVVRGI